MSQTHGLIKHYHDKYSNIEHDFRSSALRDLVLSFVQGTHVLDAGCGSGDVVMALAQKGYTVTALDSEQEMLRMTETIVRSKDIRTVRIEHNTIERYAQKTTERFDTIVCLDVIEHIEDDRLAMKQLRKMLPPNGRLILSVPAHQFLFGPKDEAIGHYRRYSQPALLNLADECGLRTMSIRHWNAIGAITTYLNLKLSGKNINESFRYTRTLTDKLLNQTLVWWFRYFERPISLPFGSSLILVADVPEEPNNGLT